MKKTLLLGALLVTAMAANATLSLTNNWSSGWDNGNVVPDNNYSGWTDTRTVTLTPGYQMVDNTLAVNLNLSGGWNGDLFAYLVNSSGGFVVLLDRVGMPTPALGYGNAGMNVTLSATGAGGDIHNYGGLGVPTGAYQPDANNAGLLPTAGSGLLSSFNGFNNPGATWTLFIADVSGGGVTTVNSWGLQMDIVAVPEVETWIAAALAGAFGAFWLNRQIMLGVKKL